MSRAVSDLLSILDLEPLEVNLFRGQSPKSGWQRVFGGQVIGQALVAATRTVDGRPPHSLHCYFMLPGDPRIPIIYEVERIRDGKSFATRRVMARQHGRPTPGSPGARTLGSVPIRQRVAAALGIARWRAATPASRQRRTMRSGRPAASEASCSRRPTVSESTATSATIAAFVDGLSDGYDTLLGPGGVDRMVSVSWP